MIQTDNSLESKPQKPWEFQRGKSGNPGGRPKSLAAKVREEVEDGDELIRVFGQILRGELTVTRVITDAKGNEREVLEEPSHKDRMTAGEWFSNRGWGKPVEFKADLTEESEFKELARAYARELILEDAKTKAGS